MGKRKKLTDNERGVCRMVASGMSNREIAIVLNVSHRTVKNNVVTISQKAAVSGRVNLVLWIFKIDIISIEDAYQQMMKTKKSRLN